MGSKNHPQMVGVFSFKRFTKNHLMNLHKYLMCGGKKNIVSCGKKLQKSTEKSSILGWYMSIINLG